MADNDENIDIDAVYDRFYGYNKPKIKNGQRLLYYGHFVTLEEYDECYGQIVIRFDTPVCRQKPCASYGGRNVDIYTKVVSITEVKISGKLK